MQTGDKCHIDEMISLYVSGEGDKETLSELSRLANESDEIRDYIREQLEICFSAGVSGDKMYFDERQAFDRFLERISQHKQAAMLWNKQWKWAVGIAVVILIVVLPMWTYRQGKAMIQESFTNMVVEAPLGARTKLYLPDGTLVWLNAGSKITYSQGFGVSNRRLALEGEGYFEVVHSKTIPFEINTNEVSLKVLGTKFNFKNYTDDEEATVNLLEGKVALHNEIRPMPELYMEANEKMTMNKHTGEMRKTYISGNGSYVSAWTKNELFFDEELLEDIVKKLMRNYNVKIEIADSLRNHRFYGSFKIVGNTIDEVLQAIASTNRMKYRYENEKYILY